MGVLRDFFYILAHWFLNEYVNRGFAQFAGDIYPLIETLYPPKDNLQAIYQDAMHVEMFYIIAILVIFVISTLHTLNLID
jgi:hypothetical protein